MKEWKNLRMCQFENLKMKEKKNNYFSWNIKPFKLFTEHETRNTKLSNLSNLSN